MASLLFIAPADPGETVLALGVLDHAMGLVDAPSVSVVCAPEVAPLFRALPGLETIHDRMSDDGFTRWMSLTWRHAKQPVDLVLDLDGQPAGYSVRARRRIMRRRSPTLRHRVEEWSDLLVAETPLKPKLWLDNKARKDAKAALTGSGPLLVLAPGADSAAKRWSAERFAAVGRRLAGGSGPLSNARIVLIGSEGDADVARAIASSLDADGVGARNLCDDLDLPAQAALLEHATLFIGNDGVAMHVAAAANAPTLGLFGPSDERVRGPYGARARALRGRDYEAIMALAHGAPPDKTLMDDIGVDAVEEAALALLRAGGLT